MGDRYDPPPPDSDAPLDAIELATAELLAEIMLSEYLAELRAEREARPASDPGPE